jgi:hypothetical protein
MIELDPNTGIKRHIHTAEDFQHMAQVVKKNHPLIFDKENATYAGCPLLYAKKDGVNMIHALHIQIAEMVWAEMLQVHTRAGESM